MEIYCHLISKMPYPFFSVQCANHEDGPRPELVVIFTLLSIVSLKIAGEGFIAVGEKKTNKTNKKTDPKPDQAELILHNFCIADSSNLVKVATVQS